MIKIEVSTHSGDLDEIHVEEYDEKTINELRNDEGVQSILIGRNSYSRIDLMNVKVIKEING